MFASLVLTTLIAAGSAHAAVAQGSWGVRADYSRESIYATSRVTSQGGDSFIHLIA